ncbi:MAG: EamA family transporter [Candidatus Altiarchaeota archaeon]
MATQLWAIGLILFSTFIGSFGSVFFKKGADRLSLSVSSLARNWALPVGFIFYVSSAAIFIYALRGGELSVLYPLVSLTYVWVCFWSIWFLGERMNRAKWIGILSIVLGVGFIGLGAK